MIWNTKKQYKAYTFMTKAMSVYFQQIAVTQLMGGRMVQRSINESINSMVSTNSLDDIIISSE